MAVCWSFATILVVTLIVLVTFSQPIFQRPDSLLIEADIEPSGAVIERRAPLNLHLLESELTYGPNMENGQRLRGRKSRKLMRRDFHPQSSRDWSCQGRRRAPERIGISEGMPARKILANYRYPRRTIHQFESDRMVPTGPNPLHNSNRSEVIFP